MDERPINHHHNHGPSVDLWLLTTANADETNSITCLPKRGGARYEQNLGTHPMTSLILKLFSNRRPGTLTTALSVS